MHKIKVLIFIKHYLPGFQSGGPIRTISNMVEHLGDSFEFRIVTTDRDALDDKAYSIDMVDHWNQVGRAQVNYLPPDALKFSKIVDLINRTDHDLLYLNSFFDPTFTLIPLLARKLKRVPNKPVILAPRGEFSEAANNLKAWKKRPFLKLSKIIGLYKNINWHASSEHEKSDIVKKLGSLANNIVIAPDLTPKVNKVGPKHFKNNTKGPLKIIFLSRIAKMKNLDFALKILARVSSPAIFNIYGTLEDEDYWFECNRLIKLIPNNITVNYCGAIPHEKVHDVLSEHDLFFLPTLGENFGHVIFEALAAGLPVLISDQTPWKELVEEGVGWDLSLESRVDFVNVIEKQAQLKNEDRYAQREKARAYAFRIATDEKVQKSNMILFESLVKK